MPANPPVYAPGYPGGVIFTPIGQTGASINVVGWDWAEEVGDNDTSSSGSGGVEERIAGMLRGKGSFQATYDLANKLSNNPPKIRAGVHGLVQFFVSATSFYQVPCMILSVPVKSVVAGKIEYTCNIGLDSASGLYIYPI